MDERHEHPERADQAGDIEADEPPGPYRFAHGGSARPHRLGAARKGSPSGRQPAIARIVLDHESHPRARDGGKHAEDEIGFAPSQVVDEERRQRRHDQRADTDPADGQARRKAAASGEPSLHRAERRNVGAADAKSDPEPVCHVDFRQIAGRACESQARPTRIIPMTARRREPHRSASGPETTPRPK